MSEIARIRGFRGLFLLGHHPWTLVVVLVVLILLVTWQNRRRR